MGGELSGFQPCQCWVVWSRWGSVDVTPRGRFPALSDLRPSVSGMPPCQPASITVNQACLIIVYNGHNAGPPIYKYLLSVHQWKD